ncbi:pilus assembly protein [Pseudomonas typographi]|uniref:Pilus assembly protein n=1 Tax=Pseudomonas typographi TaxID=2715964 RepID=A0ABR7YXM7_9PSED|nr:PilC/PilY family type IV pilus protein [Pseudomonas typographi]MBD1551059.1 pilus assembly protein [Pseudomonas typographi]MBD1597961.1 pilus assembly protein [Pseudomonas typographi]
MPSNKPKRALSKAWGWLYGIALALYLSAPAYAAFTPSPSPLMSAAAVVPNLMLLVDDSGSMNNLIRATAFDQSVVQPQLYYCSRDDDCRYIVKMDMTNENQSIGDLYRGGCSNGYTGLSWGSGRYCLKLPDPVGSGNTRYSVRYLSYLLGLMGSATTKDYTTGTIPIDYRMNVARTVASALVKANTSLRIGLATFNAPTNSNRGPGGNISQNIADLQQTTKTTSSQATANYNNLVSAISKLSAVANTPLAETYYEITRYMRGMAPYYNNTPSTYTSPLQYRCQKNFGVVITDGLPTYDRTFPPSDPAYTTTQKLPNWDNINNDGADTSGDDEGDTLYLDDVAKFAYDIDMRTKSDGTDAAGKSWDADDFKQQNMITYTVGFTAANQMLSDAASYGHGQYYQATDSDSLTTALTEALSQISSQSGSGGTGSANTTSLTSSSYYYQALYDPTDWRGTVKAFPFNTDGSLSTTASWSTDHTMAVGTTTAIYQTYSGSAVVSLAYNALSTAQQKVLDDAAKAIKTSLKGTDLVEWSKGTNNANLKARTVLMGDVINSPVTYVSPTAVTASDTSGDTSYSSYLTTKASGMTASLVVNDNSGMTSVINADSGTRRYAYMPSSALSGLSTIAATSYTDGTSHKFLNDGQVDVFDAQLGSTWGTVAVGGTGAGGKSFYAIRLFNAAGSNTPQALWEISAPSTASTTNTFNDLGYAYATPQVARLADGTWAAFIANGYGSNSGVAALYVINLATGALINKIVVDSSETDNGLSSVALRVDASDVVQYAYAGDLKGRLWKFDLTNSSSASWGLAFSGKPLFTDTGGTAQPITAPPLVVANPNGGYSVFVGTGKFMETADKTTTATQAFYAIQDTDAATANYTISNLVAQSITGSFATGGSTYMTTSQNTVDYTTKKGWYLPLTYDNTLVGERVIFKATYSSGRIIFTTAGVDTTDPCASQGYGRVVILQAFTGQMFSTSQIQATSTANSGIVLSNGYAGGVAVLTGDSADVLESNTSSGTLLNTALTSGGAGGTNRRIMWRQIQ